MDLLNFHDNKNNNNTAPSERMALLLGPINNPPLARLETFEDDSKDHKPKTPKHSSDEDVFVPPKSDPDAEFIPKEPEIPDFNSRAGPAGEGGGEDENTNNPDIETVIPIKPPSRRPSAEPSDPGEVDGVDGKFPPKHPNFDFPNFDVEFGSNPDIPDVNVYQHKKTLAQGMMDLALFSANANQLRYVLESGGSHAYFYPSIVLIALSLVFQVAVGIGLIWNATYNVKDDKEICVANRINNFTIIGIFLVTVINVFISAFGVGGQPLK